MLRKHCVRQYHASKPLLPWGLALTKGRETLASAPNSLQFADFRNKIGTKPTTSALQRFCLLLGGGPTSSGRGREDRW